MEPVTIKNENYEAAQAIPASVTPQPPQVSTTALPAAPEPEAEAAAEAPRNINPYFSFMGIGSLIYAFFYTFFLYKNTSGITYPFFLF